MDLKFTVHGVQSFIKGHVQKIWSALIKVTATYTFCGFSEALKCELCLEIMSFLPGNSPSCNAAVFFSSSAVSVTTFSATSLVLSPNGVPEGHNKICTHHGMVRLVKLWCMVRLFCQTFEISWSGQSCNFAIFRSISANWDLLDTSPKTMVLWYSRPSVIRTSIIRTLDYPNLEADENYWFKVQEIIITSSFIIISARTVYTFFNFVSISVHDS